MFTARKSRHESNKPPRDYSVVALVAATFTAVGLLANSGFLMDRTVPLAVPIGHVKLTKPAPRGPAEGERFLFEGPASARKVEPMMSEAGIRP